MRGLFLVSLALLASLAVACARGDTGGFGGFGGGEATGSTTSSGQGGASTSASSTSSSGTTSGGGVPATCAQANGSVGCCNNNTAYYCKTPTGSMTVTPCTSGKVCGWEASKNYYTCVAAPGGADPSNAYPEQCP